MVEELFFFDDFMVDFFSCWKCWRGYEIKIGDVKGDMFFVLLKKMFVGREMYVKVWRDRVYLLLGLVVNVEVLGIRFDYGDLWGEEKMVEIMIDVVRRMIMNDYLEWVDVLCYLRFLKEVLGLLFWVLDWKMNMVKLYY